MALLQKLASGLRGLFRKHHVERELDEELRGYLESAAAENMRAGMSPAEALRAARLAMGSLEGVKEDVRSIAWENLLASTWQDLRFGLRLLRKSPGFTAAAVLTLALGIGVNTTIFSMVNGLLFRPFPIQDPARVMSIAYQRPGGWANGISYPNFQDIQTQTTQVFSSIAGYAIGQDGLTLNGKTEPFETGYVTGDFFSLMGIQPFLGRFILPTEGKVAGADPVLVLGYSYWKTRFGSDPGVVGKQVAVNGRPVTIIGVAPKDFLGATTILDTQGYLPIGMASIGSSTAPDFMTNRNVAEFLVVTRLQEQATPERANAALLVVSQRLSEQYPKTNKDVVFHAFSLRPPGPVHDPNDNPISAIASLFLSLAALPLVLACVNVANLLLVRAGARRHEMSIRAALGAARGRLVRQLLAESVLLGVFGCVAGIFLGVAGIQAIGLIPLREDFAFVLDFHFDWRVLAYSCAAALLAGIFVGIVPAFRASRGDISAVMHDGGRTSTSSRQRLRNVLVVAQVGGSLMLLVVAGLFARSLRNAQHVDLGFNPDHVFNLTLDPNEIGYTKTQAITFYRDLLDRVRATPGVQSASLAAWVPMGDTNTGDTLEIPGYQIAPGQAPPSADYNGVTPGYLQTMGIALLRGRDINEKDTKDSPRVALINDHMAKHFWPGQDPLGRKFVRKHEPGQQIEVIGIMRNSTTDIPPDDFGDLFYVPFAQSYASVQTLQVRTTSAPETMSHGIVDVIQSLAPAMPVFHVRTMREQLYGINGLFLFEFGAGLAASMGMLGLALAVVGVYGVVSYAAGQRTQEIGIRMAMGAQPGQILQMIFRQGLYLVAIGVATGLFAAYGISRLVGNFLVGVAPTDPLTYLSASLLLASIALAACYIPARRATRIDPMMALRYE